jgi:CDP-diacylglycerol--serine O-phosphatidyltransferase
MSEVPPTAGMGRAGGFEPRRRRRRRSRAGGQRRGLHLLPNLFTTANLFCGFYTIVQATLGDPWHAALGIVLAMVFDILDGRVARLARATSRFGAEYDSLSDIVSFGVAPAMLAFAGGDLRDLGRAGWVLTFLYVVCAALRLARFNVAPSRFKGRFEGLPSPAAAGMLAATAWFALFLEERFGQIPFPAAGIAVGTALLGLLMVSRIPYRSFKELDLRHGYGTLVLLAILLPLVAIEPQVTLFFIGLAYVASGPIDIWLRWRSGAVLEEHASPPDGEEEESFGGPH